MGNGVANAHLILYRKGNYHFRVQKGIWFPSYGGGGGGGNIMTTVSSYVFLDWAGRVEEPLPTA